MIFPWPEDVLGEPPSAWVWYTSTELDMRDTSFKLDAAEALINEFVLNLTARERLKDILLEATRGALLELGTPDDSYPASVSNAVERLSEALKTGGWALT
jgi:hypothetical protein